MLKKLLLSLYIALVPVLVYAQADSITSSVPKGLRVSLLTCGTGTEIWETFGHTAVRIIDSARGMDIVYNYGTFAFDKDFEAKFMRGKLMYYISSDTYESFMEEYQEYKRSVEEQVLNINQQQAMQIYEYLQNNALPENREYKYDFFFDNCSTRIRDIFSNTFGDKFKFGRTIPENSKITYRDIMNRYLYRVHWERFGINMLLGSRIDRPMTNAEIMFLPDYLRDGITGATLEGKPISGKPQLILAGSEHEPAGLNEPLVVMWFIAILTILGLTIRQLKVVGRIMSFTVLLITGILGWIMLFMWLGTDHQGCANNFNLLWALPTNLFMAFMLRKGRGRYALIGIVLIVVSLLLHVFKVQVLPLLELSPLLLALLFVFGTIYKRGKPELATT